jgi:hypothetical protein
LAKITRTQQRRLVASSIAFILAAAMMMPTTTDARGGGRGGHGGHGGGHAGNILGFNHHHSSPPVGFPFAVARVPFSSRHTFAHGRLAHSHAIGSQFWTLGTDGTWIESFESSPPIVVMQEPSLAQEPALRPSTALVRTPGPEQDGILVVRGTSRAYVTFPSGKPG